MQSWEHFLSGRSKSIHAVNFEAIYAFKNKSNSDNTIVSTKFTFFLAIGNLGGQAARKFDYPIIIVIGWDNEITLTDLIIIIFPFSAESVTTERPTDSHG